MAHVAEDREDDAASDDGGQGDEAGHHDRVLDEVAVKLVVGAQGNQAAEGAVEGVEDLSPGVNPDLRLHSITPFSLSPD